MMQQFELKDFSQFPCVNALVKSEIKVDVCKSAISSLGMIADGK